MQALLALHKFDASCGSKSATASTTNTTRRHEQCPNASFLHSILSRLMVVLSRRRKNVCKPRSRLGSNAYLHASNANATSRKVFSELSKKCRYIIYPTSKT
ncbi:hypothetical protein ABVK25_005103 [Lepraria finkii]|uniref:Uncharacterized protein n=1 Tax=Lepraria finkii TaxID=1340010 RepID=A0ABR4BDB2_9LECA